MSARQTLVAAYSLNTLQWDWEGKCDPERPKQELPLSAIRKVPTYLFVAPSGARVLTRVPVDVEVEQEGPDAESHAQAWVFSCKKLHVFASASSYKVAEDLFHEQVVHFYYFYRDIDPNQLNDDAAQIHELFKKYFEESAPPLLIC